MSQDAEIRVKRFKLAYVIALDFMLLGKRPPLNIEKLEQSLQNLACKGDSSSALCIEEIWRPNQSGGERRGKDDEYFNELRKLDIRYFTPAIKRKERYLRLKFRPITINVSAKAIESHRLHDFIQSNVKITPMLLIHTFGVSILTLIVDIEVRGSEGIPFENLLDFIINLLKHIPPDFKYGVAHQLKSNGQESIIYSLIEDFRTLLREHINKAAQESRLAKKIFDSNDLGRDRNDIAVPLTILSIWNYSCDCPYHNDSQERCVYQQCPLTRIYVYKMLVKRTLGGTLIPNHGLLDERCLSEFLGTNISLVGGSRVFVHWGGALQIVDNGAELNDENIMEQFFTLVWLEELTLFIGYLLVIYNDFVWKVWSRLRKDPRLFKKVNPSDLGDLRDDLLGALEEFHGVSLIRDYLIRSRLYYLRRHLRIERDYKALNWRLRVLSGVIEAKYDEETKKREQILTILVGALGLVGISSFIYDVTLHTPLALILMSMSLMLYILSFLLVRDIIMEKMRALRRVS